MEQEPVEDGQVTPALLPPAVAGRSTPRLWVRILIGLPVFLFGAYLVNRDQIAGLHNSTWNWFLQHGSRELTTGNAYAWAHLFVMLCLVAGLWPLLRLPRSVLAAGLIGSTAVLGWVWGKAGSCWPGGDDGGGFFWLIIAGGGLLLVGFWSVVWAIVLLVQSVRASGRKIVRA
jgi:hypothetical protein